MGLLREWISKRSLAIVLLALWWLTWAGYFISLAIFNAHADSLFWEWMTGTLENIQSENYQTLMMVLATAYFIYEGSAESRDQSDRIEAKINLLLAKLGRGDS